MLFTFPSVPFRLQAIDSTLYQSFFKVSFNIFINISIMPFSFQHANSFYISNILKFTSHQFSSHLTLFYLFYLFHVNYQKQNCYELLLKRWLFFFLYLNHTPPLSSFLPVLFDSFRRKFPIIPDLVTIIDNI